jgi:hypothetical protein
VTGDGFKLGQWVTVRRHDRANGKLSDDRAAELESLPGWSWHTRNDRFEQNLAVLQRYVAQHGDAQVPHGHVTSDGFDLSRWITKQQSAYKADRLTPERIAAFEALPGWSWGRHTARFEDGVRALRSYVELHRDACVPQPYVTADGFGLGGWVAVRRQEHRKGVLSARRVSQLESLSGWLWTVPPRPRTGSFDAGMAALLDYAAEHHHGHVPVTHIGADGFRLGAWVSRRRAEHKRGELAADRIRKLEEVPGWTWEGRPGRA